MNGEQVQNEQIFSTNHFISTFGTDQNNDLYFASYTTGMIYKIVGTPVTSVDKVIPEDYKLEQNYPNPFNPTTVIRYQLSATANTKLTIYDSLGKEVRQLVNGLQTPGSYSYNFTANDLASGIYYYQLVTENFTDTKKMVLLR